jgi:putative two-component system response regulator
VSPPNTNPLSVLLHSNVAAGEPEVKLALSRLSVEIKRRLNNPPSPNAHDFFVSVLRALSRVKGGAHAEARMACLCDSVFFFYANDSDVEALEAVRQLDEIAGRAQIKGWLRKSEMVGGQVYADLGNVAGGIVRLSNALVIAREIGDAAVEVSVLASLGCALMYGGLYNEAIRCLERAVTLSREHCDDPAIVNLELGLSALTNLAQSHYYLGEFEAGFAAISVCLSKSKEPAGAFPALSRSIREFTYVLLTLSLGKLDSACEHAAICRRYAEFGGSRSRVVAEISEGLCDVYRGDVTKGLKALEASLVHSNRISALRTAALLALVRALDEIGQPERALMHVREVLEQMKAEREKGALVLLSRRNLFDISETGIAAEGDDLRALKLSESDLRAQVAELEVLSTRMETLERLAITADLKEDSSGEHGYRVGRLSSLLAKDLGWSGESCHALELAARLHDIGKIGMPGILMKSGGLLASERHFLDAHVSVGAELLSKSGMPHFRLAEEVARFHHEWWDGSGYPLKLPGARIPIHARIVALADVFDALTHGRPYADAWPAERAMAEIRSRRGTQFDPELTDRFLEIVARLLAQHANLDAALSANAESSTFLQARNNIRRLLDKESESVRKEAEAIAIQA